MLEVLHGRHRNGLAILLPPNTGRVRDDHLENPFWFGEILPRKGEILAEDSDEVMDVEPNTTPAIK